MAQYREKRTIEATQWFKNGDHPEDGNERFPPKGPIGRPDGSASDPRYTEEFAGELLEGKVVRYFRHPGVSGESLCEHCNVRMHEHGWLDTGMHQILGETLYGYTVCPGDFILTTRLGYRVSHPDSFAATYEAVEPNSF